MRRNHAISLTRSILIQKRSVSTCLPLERHSVGSMFKAPKMSCRSAVLAASRLASSTRTLHVRYCLLSDRMMSFRDAW